MDKLEYSVVIMDDGEQIPVSVAPNVRVEGVYIGPSRSKDIIKLNIDGSEFEKLDEQAVRNKIPKATLDSGQRRHPLGLPPSGSQA